MEPSQPHVAERFALRARWVFPVASEPIENGVVTIEDGRIAAVGRAGAAETGLTDLGNVALLPGLINAHTHLDLSGFDRPIGEPGVHLADWIPQVIAAREERSGLEFTSIGKGLAECRRMGNLVVADIAASGWPDDLLEHCPRQTTVFQELIGPTPERIRSALERARRHLVARRGSHCRLGLSPHAPYTVHPELLRAAIDLAAASGAPLAMHLAESPEEIELLATGMGPLRELLESLGAWSPGLVVASSRPIDYLRRLADAPSVLVVHGNYLEAPDWAFLAQRRNRMSVVYCPRSHAHFRYKAYPLAEMMAAGVNVCLGTDSRASVPNLSLLEEMRFAAAWHPGVCPSAVVEMATHAGARALNCQSELGSLEPGKRAHIAAVALPSEPAGEPYAMLFRGQGRVVAVWEDGVPVS